MENDTPDIPDNLGDLREQIQAAQAALSADVPDALPLAPTFYSRLQLAIMGLGGKPIASEAVKNRLKKSGKEGFSEEEWKWSGMDEFLGGRKTVTKDELLKHFEENQVELIEVFKGSNLSTSEREEMMQLESKRLAGESLTREQRARFMDLTSRKDDTSKYSQYQTPGGENYRELLLMLQEEKHDKTKPHPGAEIRHQIKNGIESWGIYDKQGKELTNAPSEDVAIELSHEFNALKETYYQSSHWDEPNILAHVRFNDRTGPSGEKILHVEEIQSDWHQAGRETGYASPDRDERLAEVREQLGDLDRKMSDWRDALQTAGLERAFAMDYTDEQLSRLHGKKLISDEQFDLYQRVRPQWKEYNQQWDELNKQRSLLENPVPDAPFKENWHELAMKRMLRYAAENDYDRITLNPGEQINKVLGSGAGALEGQKQFYDVTLPNTMAKLGKPFGATVEPFAIGKSKEEVEQEIWNMRQNYAGQGLSLMEAQEEIARLKSEAESADTYRIETASLPITPAMSQSILSKGMPMMAEGGDVPDRFGISYARENMGSFDDEREPMPVNEEDDLSELLAAIGDLDDATEKLIGAIERQEQEESRPSQMPTSNAGGKPRFGKNLGGDGRLSVDMLAAYARARQ